MIADAVVVGGGPAGATAALALASAGRSVVLLARRNASIPHTGEVLCPEIRESLQQLGIWEDFLADQPKPAHGIWSAWGTSRPVARDFIANPYGPGWCVDRQQFDRMLLTAAERAGVRILALSDGLRVERFDGGWRINARLGCEALSIEARMAVDASGRASAVARVAGSRRRTHDSLLALIATLAPTHAPADGDDILLIESVPTGWWYSTALPGGELVAAFLTDADFLRHSSQHLPDELWFNALETAPLTASRADGHERRSFHLRDARVGAVERAAGRNWVAVGDAASTIDPLSGLGVTKALRSALVAARAVDQALSGNHAALESYAVMSQAGFEVALRTGSNYYAWEQRWPESLFWRRRRI